MNTVQLPTASASPYKPVGCATCRIRRKKCPVDLDAEGACSLCRRLGVECWGYGQPLPSWTKDPQTLQNYKKQLQTAVVLNRQRIFYESQGHNAGSLSTYGQGEQAFSVFSVANTSFPEDLNDLDVDTQSLSDLMNSVGAVDASSSPTTHYSPMPQNLNFTHAPADTYGFYNGQGHPNS